MKKGILINIAIVAMVVFLAVGCTQVASSSIDVSTATLGTPSLQVKTNVYLASKINVLTNGSVNNSVCQYSTDGGTVWTNVPAAGITAAAGSYTLRYIGGTAISTAAAVTVSASAPAACSIVATQSSTGKVKFTVNDAAGVAVTNLGVYYTYAKSGTTYYGIVVSTKEASIPQGCTYSATVATFTGDNILLTTFATLYSSTTISGTSLF